MVGGVPIPGSNEHQGGVLDEALDFVDELGSDGSIDDAVVAADAKVHAKAGNDGSVLNDGLLDDTSNAENGCLWRVDDGVEGLGGWRW